MGEGFDKLKQTMSEIKGEIKQEKAIIQASNDSADRVLASLANSPLASKFSQNANRGSENLSLGKLPLIKLFQTGKTESVLADGSEPHNGWFFYSPDQTEYEKVICHILTVSRGYYAKPKKDGDKAKFTQIMGGVMINNNEMKPFVMYVTGLKLSPFWDFTRDVVGLYTHAKPIPVPMFCLTVVMKSEKVKTEYGQSFTLNFDLVKDDDGFPVIVQDEGKFEFLNSMIDELNGMINSVIQSNDTQDNPNIIMEAEEVLGK